MLGLAPHRLDRTKLRLKRALADDAVHHHEELAEMNGLDEVIIRAAAQRLHSRLDGAKGRHDDDAAPHLVGSKSTDEPQTVEIGHLQVCQHDVGGPRLTRPERGLAVLRPARVESLVLEEFAKRLACAGLVIDDKNAYPGC